MILMIKDDSKQGNSGLDEMAVLSELNFFAPKSNVNRFLIYRISCR
ncbi:MAG: hypothetical protein LBC19_09010 [Tannerella sp.]|nr:hypothetical protein [Tannerella sp.]